MISKGGPLKGVRLITTKCTVNHTAMYPNSGPVTVHSHHSLWHASLRVRMDSPPSTCLHLVRHCFLVVAADPGVRLPHLICVLWVSQQTEEREELFARDQVVKKYGSHSKAQPADIITHAFKKYISPISQLLPPSLAPPSPPQTTATTTTTNCHHHYCK